MVNVDKEKCKDGGTGCDCGGKNLLNPEDKRMLCPIGTDEDEVEGEVRRITGKEIDVLVCFQGVRNNA